MSGLHVLAEGIAVVIGVAVILTVAIFGRSR